MNRNRILIVDDNPTNILILEEILGAEFALASAANGEAALAKAAEFQPELVLLDIMMPGMNGYETCRRMRTTPALRHRKIVMVSAKAMVSERVEGYEAGADDHITKPFDEEELIAKVRIYLKLCHLEEIDKLKTDILTLLNHETRTPLNNIIPVVEMLLEEGPMDPQEHRHWLSIIRKHADRLYRLLDKGIRLSAMKNQAWRFNFASADLCAVVCEAIADASGAASERNIVIEHALPASVTTVFDREQIRSVVDIMLENAVRFSPPGGYVRVRVTQTTEAVRLSICDQGPGIAPEFTGAVFDEFTDPDPAHHTEGQHLSLALAWVIAQAHEGEITLDSAAAGSTAFSLTLPVGDRSNRS